MLLARTETAKVIRDLSFFPAVCLLGPRQVGKTTLAKSLGQERSMVYLDLERPSDLAKLNDPETYLETHKDQLVCLDEIQRRPDLFLVLRSLIDAERRPGRFLLLGSASPELLQQTSESLAGRIAYHELTPFTVTEMQAAGGDKAQLWRQALWRGGFPDAFLAPSDALSLAWRENFLTTFLERDLANLGSRVPPAQMRRLWLMCAHSQGQVINYSKLGQSLDVTHPTVKAHIDLLIGSFMLRSVPPWETNLKKRLVKSPKLYFRDQGLYAALMGLGSFEQLYSYPDYGLSWEGYAIEEIIRRLPSTARYGFFRTQTGDEIDLVFSLGGDLHGVEIKASSAPQVEAKIVGYLDAIRIKTFSIVVPHTERYPILSGRGTVLSLADFVVSLGQQR